MRKASIFMGIGLILCAALALGGWIKLVAADYNLQLLRQVCLKST